MRIIFKKVKKIYNDYITQLSKNFSDVKILITSVIVLTVLFVLDILNIPSEFIIGQPIEILVLISVAIVIIIMLLLKQSNIFDRIKMPVINSVDGYITGSIVISVIGVLFWCIKDGFLNYKTLISAILFGIGITIRVIRMFYCKNMVPLENMSLCNVFDLKDIYDNSFEVKSGDVIFIEEKEIDYDMLNRYGIIQQLYDVVSTFKSNRSFVIGLIGEWGTGKTTILKNLKKTIYEKNKDIIVIDDFDPWIFGTQEAFLISMYDTILQHIGIKYSVSKNRNNAKILSTIVSDIGSAVTNVSGAGRLLDLLSFGNDDIVLLKEEMSMFLNAQNKTVVFIIDNIDRAESDNIIMLFKLIATVFDLPNLVYILSYDKERVEDILCDTKKINPKYFEKIVNKELYIPSIWSEQKRNIYGTCIENILVKYGVNKNDIREYIPICDFICDNVDNLRNFKRLINTVFPPVFTTFNKLNKFELLVIELIHFLEPSLYNDIRINSTYFVSYHIELNEKIYAKTLSKEKFNDELKEFFSNLIKRYPNYKNLLTMIFPRVKNFNMFPNSIAQNIINKEELKSVEKNMSICSVKFFDLYFSYGENGFLDLASLTKEFFGLIESNVSEISVYNSFLRLFNSIKRSEHKPWIESFQQYVDDIPDKYGVVLAMAIWENISLIDDSDYFLALSPKQRALHIIALLVSKSKIDEFEIFANTICNDFSNFLNVRDMIYWMKHLHSKKEQDIENLINTIEQIYHSHCKEVIENRIDIYDDQNYNRNNIIGLFDPYKTNENKDKILSQYIKDIFNPQYIYRYIGDMIKRSVGNNGYGYEISSDDLKWMYISEDMIDNAIKSCPPNTPVEAFVLQVYEKYRNREENIFGGYGIYTKEEIELEL